jgi:radical S-adenosyl methionine domain-containing protein 2
MLRDACDNNLVTSIVTNGSRIDEAWLHQHGPHLRWLTLSIDSIDAATAKRLGRHAGPADYQHPEHVQHVARMVHAWNAKRPPSRRIRLKLNITVTRENQHEDPSEFLVTMLPEKVKVLQMLRVTGENDDAEDLACSDEAFAAYAQRLEGTSKQGIDIVVESEDLMDGSYAMVDPQGRFYQRVDGRYLQSEPIQDVGIATAWASVGGYSKERFEQRRGAYEPGEVARGNRPYWIAIEGIDGCGKSTTVAELAKLLDAAVVTNPPESMEEERAPADALPSAERRNWYLGANKRAIDESEDHRAAGRAVVMDRSVASTLAFAAAEAQKPVESWPDRWPRPDLLVLLHVDEAERKRRIDNRGMVLTGEEQRLSADSAFRERVLAAYKEFGAVQVQAGGPPDQLAKTILAMAARSVVESFSIVDVPRPTLVMGTVVIAHAEAV